MKFDYGTETTYTYDKQRERLQVMNLTADGQTVMENRYRYDALWIISSVLRMLPTQRRLQNSIGRSWEEGVRIRMSMTS